jgi:hypothetical protein
MSHLRMYENPYEGLHDSISTYPEPMITRLESMINPRLYDELLTTFGIVDDKYFLPRLARGGCVSASWDAETPDGSTVIYVSSTYLLSRLSLPPALFHLRSSAYEQNQPLESISAML